MDQFGLFLTDLLTFRYLVLESNVEMSKWVVTEMLGSAYLIFKSLSVHDWWSPKTATQYSQSWFL